MKTIIFYLTCIVLIHSNLLIAQSISLNINEETLSMSKGNNNAFTVEIPQTKASDIKKAWESYVKKSSKKPDAGYSKSEYYALQVQIEAIAEYYFNIYGTFTQTITGTKLAVWFQLQDTFVSSNNNALTSKSIKAYLHSFAKENYLNAAESELKIEQKILNKLNDELDDLYKDKDKLTNEITDNKNDIVKAQSDIKMKINEQKLKDKEILMQREKMIGVSLNPAEKKLQDKIIKDLNKEKQGFVKEEQKLRKSIQKCESNIKKNEREILKFDTDISNKQAEINTQKKRIVTIETKISEITRL